MEKFQVLLNCVDHYQAIQTSFDPQLPVNAGPAPKSVRPKVPVIRVFGATETGQKVCAHIHGAFPYLYIEYQGSLNPKEVNTAIRTLHLSIDHALAVSYRRNAYEKKTAYVAHITLVKGVPFYGYHVGYRFFFKIYLFNPMHMTRLADLLRQGAVMKRVLQPYESHLQYLSQWMCDYNLYGCAYLKSSKVTFRAPIPTYLENSTHIWHDRSIPESAVFDSFTLPRQSHCDLEVDIHVQDIINRAEVKERPIHQDFMEMLQPSIPGKMLVPSLAGLWEEESRRRRGKLNPSDTDSSSPFRPEELVSMSADPRNTGPGGWIHEEEYRTKIEAVTDEEHLGRKPTFADFVATTPFEATIRSSLSSVEDLFPENIQAVQPENLGMDDTTAEESRIHIEVDESCILPPRQEEVFSYDSDDDGLNGSFLHEQEVEIAGDLEPNPPEGPASSLDFNDQEVSNAATEAVVEEQADLLELKRFGVRPYTELINSQEDVFEIDESFISDITSHPNVSKRANPSVPERDRENKRFKPDNDSKFPAVTTRASHDRLKSAAANTLSADGSTDLESIAVNHPLSSQLKQSQKRTSSYNGNKRISFHVVKDAHDPATISRLSQQDNLSQKSQPQGPKQGRSQPVSVPDPETPSHNSETSSELNHTGTSSSSILEPQPCLYESFNIPQESKIFSFIPRCPPLSEVLSTMHDDGRPSIIYQGPHYGNEDDVPHRAREYAGREFKLESVTVPYLPPFDATGYSPALFGDKPPVIINGDALEKDNNKLRKSCSLRTWEFAPTAPSRSEVIEWLEEETRKFKDANESNAPSQKPTTSALSQIEGPTQKNRHGFKYSQKKPTRNVRQEAQYMSVMSLEVHVNTRGILVPNPEEDEISCIIWCVQDGETGIDDDDDSGGMTAGIIALAENESLAAKISPTMVSEFDEETTELDLLTKLVDVVRQRDPDILTGYEVHNSSWGYLIERARYKFDYDLCDELSRVKTSSHGRIGKENDRWGFNHTSSIRVTGRHMINIWRAMRGELNLLQYTMENVVFHLLHQRIPHYAFQDLTKWFTSKKPRDIAKVINYFVSRVQLNLKIIEANELVSRTSEQARILGIDFFSVFSRGSQFKVESLMFRIAKPENFILISPGRTQVGQQNALECLPLVMEPQSDFYTSPLLVLDFQSLYPSIMIAYNYCYSTCLGRVVNWRGQNKLGFIDFRRPAGILELFKDQVNIAPNGIIYAKQEIRRSLLAKMLIEILETRVMVKGGMKAEKDDKYLQRLLNNRQLALKLIANVTYGYTSASFSGRMPCAEIADSIVQTARETLEKAIALIHSVERWGAEVVYGDTDSIFVYLKGRTREEAFDIGEEIARKVTNSNPRPVKLKFEKVYHPCVLLAKKRYVGYKYESRSQKDPDFDAKGIETVRRDGTPAEQKIEEKALKILFETADLSRVKSYFQKQCAKIMQGKVSIQDFCFAKEVRLGTYSERGMPPPGALISAKRMLEDPRTEAQYGERIPYVVISGAPGARLIDRCVSPEVLLHDSQLELDAEYYISKNLIPPLERIFNLVGANVRQWYDEMPKYQRVRRIDGGTSNASANKEGFSSMKKTLESYMKLSSCVVCRDKLEEGEERICGGCLRDGHISLLQLKHRLMREERKKVYLHKVCRSCMGVSWGEDVKCDSKDCPVFYTRTRQESTLMSTRAAVEPVISILEDQSDEGPLSW
ncbi:DNA polymerase zeta subunit [Blastomyces dermatitidis ATCC 18188]|uniref:DNA polymerase n=1 Tax=Ajellomyces dermatitidis (strain ATCC 18188 / CBS 674.68) TaxID=653446 RepID=F2T6I8_AJEDA|nr:DNA polymerase zeta subunit [Blastomyces dermatitidis ATCC 18188]